MKRNIDDEKLKHFLSCFIVKWWLKSTKSVCNNLENLKEIFSRKKNLVLKKI
jgi:hypothetical protein